MPRINGIDFYQNRSKIKLFLPKKKFFFVCWWIRPPHPMPPVAGGLAHWPQLLPVVEGSAPRPHNASPHRRFLATHLNEEKITARYCRPPFVLAFGFKYTVILIQKNYLKKSFHLHQSHFGFGRDDVFSFWALYALLISSKGQNNAI